MGEVVEEGRREVDETERNEVLGRCEKVV